MTQILTADDARAVRMLVKKALKEMPFDITEAEDGEQGLAKVAESAPDLILLDVTMPVMDGPTMLQKLRSQGNHTPVILLTAESGTSIIGPMLQQGGVNEYIIKPFKPEQLRAKVLDALQKSGVVPTAETPGRPAQGNNAGPGGPVGKTFVDVLLIDDMDNVAKKLKSMLPESLSFNSSVDRRTAMTLCRERVYRTVVIDTEMPDVDTIDLLRDLRILQPTAAFVALVMRSADKPEEFVSQKRFDSFMVKPFNPVQVEEFIGAYFDNRDLLTIDDNVLRPAPFKGSAAGADAYYKRLATMIVEALDGVAAACYETVVLDLNEIDPSPALQKMLIKLAEQAPQLGLQVRVAGPEQIDSLVKQLVETKDIGVYGTIDEAVGA